MAKSSVNDKHEGEKYCRDKIFWLKSLTANVVEQESLLNYSNRSFLDIHGVPGEYRRAKQNSHYFWWFEPT